MEQEPQIEIELEWMPVYWERLLAGTTYFDASEFGAYMLLIVEQWKKGFVPNEHKRLLKITRLRSKEKLLTVLEKFKPDGKGNLINQVCDEIRKAQFEKYVRKSKQAKGAAEKRWKSNADGMRTASEPHTDKESKQIKETTEVVNNNSHTAHGNFDLKFFIEQGYEWGLDIGIANALNEFLIYRNKHPEHGPVKSGEQIEYILRGFIDRKVTSENAVKMFRYTIERGAKNVIYELPTEKNQKQFTNGKKQTVSQPWRQQPVES